MILNTISVRIQYTITAAATKFLTDCLAREYGSLSALLQIGICEPVQDWLWYHKNDREIYMIDAMVVKVYA